MSEREYSFHNDRQALHVIATNTRRAAQTLDKIYNLLCIALGLGIAMFFTHQIKTEGWRSLFGGWL